MKNDLTCGVVRDLLPSYVEGLLGKESREAVDRHLETCPECTARRDAMSAPAETTALEAAKEVDYLKQVKRRSMKKVALAVLCTALVLTAALALKVFVIGTPLQPQSVSVAVAEVQEGNVLYLSLSSTGSGNAFHGWKVEVGDEGIASVYARSVLVSPLHSSGQKELYVSLEDVREVWLGGISGRLLWAEGLVITQKTLDLLDAKTPYCGDAPALGRIVDLLQIRDAFGPCSTSLHTSNEPYIWTLEFQEGMNEKVWKSLRAYLFQMLALVGNLDEAAYTYKPDYAFYAFGRTSEDCVREGSVTAERASLVMANLTESYNTRNGTDWPIHESIKEYAESPLEYQRMVTLLRERFDVWQYPGWQ